MYPFDYLAWSIKNRHSELLKQAQEYRKLGEAFRTEKPSRRGISKFLNLVGRELGNVGFSFELRYGGQPEISTLQNQPGDLLSRS